MAKVKVLNWYDNPKLVKGLRKFFVKRSGNMDCSSFVTMRHGPKWANKLSPGDRVAISISNDLRKPNIIGYAEVGIVKKSIIYWLGFIDEFERDLVENIGAKTMEGVLADMQSVYGSHVGIRDVISIIELIGPEKSN
ncbi:MAG: hypothetical protein HYX21_03340 [Candidatus Yanofskybacteria bacterium]|nr:hypothetical protein [Candidatus Yanofskybacteria bacterium]